MRFYPGAPPRFANRLVSDVLVVVAIILLALLGLKVRDSVNRLVVVPQGVRETGSAVQSGFQDAGDAVDGVPIVGGELSDAFESAGEGSGGRVEALGQEGVDRVHRLADLVGLIVFGLRLRLLVWYLPPRLALVRRLTAASQVLDDQTSPERRRLIAMRAAFALPYETLLRYTPDPLGDLEAERYDGLIAAVLNDSGLGR